MEKDKIHLGGTARSPNDAISLNKIGLQFAEISITDVDEFSALKDEYLAMKDELGMYYLCHGPQEGNPNDTKTLENTYLPKLFRILSIMPDLDMRLLTVHLWMDPRFVSQEAIVYKIGLLNRVTRKADVLGITVCLENLSENSSHLAGVFKALPLLNLTLDLGHAQLLSEVNTSYGFMDKHAGRIKHIHLHDNRGGDSPEDDLHLPVGNGTIDFQQIFRGLKKIGYHGTITLELRPLEIKECLGYVKGLLRDIDKT